jgi:hypothetical protein
VGQCKEVRLGCGALTAVAALVREQNLEKMPVWHSPRGYAGRAPLSSKVVSLRNKGEAGHQIVGTFSMQCDGFGKKTMPLLTCIWDVFDTRNVDAGCTNWVA